MASDLLDYALPFELPKNFMNPDKYDPGVVPDEVFENVPVYIGEAVFAVLGDEVPLDPQVILVYLRNGLLPHYVIEYFLSIQKKKNLSNQTRLFRALMLVHRFREFHILPAPHFLSQFDTAAIQNVGRRAGEGQATLAAANQDVGGRAEEDQAQSAAAIQDDVGEAKEDQAMPGGKKGEPLDDDV